MKSLVITAALATLLTTGMVPSAATAAAKPDLKVSAIATPGGICSQNKVRVNISNSQQAGVNQPVPVILTISQPPNQPSSQIRILQNGIGPNTNTGLPVWFNNIPLQANGGPVTLKAHVNPDFDVEESVYNNNFKVITANCGPQLSASLLAFWKIIVVDYLKRPISGAVIDVAGKRGKTDKFGTVVFK